MLPVIAKKWACNHYNPSKNRNCKICCQVIALDNIVICAAANSTKMASIYTKVVKEKDAQERTQLPEKILSA